MNVLLALACALTLQIETPLSLDETALTMDNYRGYRIRNDDNYRDLVTGEFHKRDMRIVESGDPVYPLGLASCGWGLGCATDSFDIRIESPFRDGTFEFSLADIGYYYISDTFNHYESFGWTKASPNPMVEDNAWTQEVFPGVRYTVFAYAGPVVGPSETGRIRFDGLKSNFILGETAMASLPEIASFPMLATAATEDTYLSYVLDVLDWGDLDMFALEEEVSPASVRETTLVDFKAGTGETRFSFLPSRAYTNPATTGPLGTRIEQPESEVEVTCTLDIPNNRIFVNVPISFISGATVVVIDPYETFSTSQDDPKLILAGLRKYENTTHKHDFAYVGIDGAGTSCRATLDFDLSSCEITNPASATLHVTWRESETTNVAIALCNVNSSNDYNNAGATVINPATPYCPTHQYANPASFGYWGGDAGSAWYTEGASFTTSIAGELNQVVLEGSTTGAGAYSIPPEVVADFLESTLDSYLIFYERHTDTGYFRYIYLEDDATVAFRPYLEIWEAEPLDGDEARTFTTEAVGGAGSVSASWVFSPTSEALVDTVYQNSVALKIVSATGAEYAVTGTDWDVAEIVEDTSAQSTLKLYDADFSLYGDDAWGVARLVHQSTVNPGDYEVRAIGVFDWRGSGDDAGDATEANQTTIIAKLDTVLANQEEILAGIGNVGLSMNVIECQNIGGGTSVVSLPAGEYGLGASIPAIIVSDIENATPDGILGLYRAADDTAVAYVNWATSGTPTGWEYEWKQYSDPNDNTQYRIIAKVAVSQAMIDAGTGAYYFWFSANTDSGVVDRHPTIVITDETGLTGIKANQQTIYEKLAAFATEQRLSGVMWGFSLEAGEDINGSAISDATMPGYFDIPQGLPYCTVNYVVDFENDTRTAVGIIWYHWKEYAEETSLANMIVTKYGDRAWSDESPPYINSATWDFGVEYTGQVASEIIIGATLLPEDKS